MSKTCHDKKKIKATENFARNLLNERKNLKFILEIDKKNINNNSKMYKKIFSIDYNSSKCSKRQTSCIEKMR